jgi:cytochrome P450
MVVAPAYKGHPLLGALPELRRNRLKFLVKLAREGPVAGFRVGPVVAHLVTEPALVKHVLLDHQRNYSKQTRGFEKLRLLLGNGLLTSEGDFWLRQRRIAQPAFHKERIASFGALMSKVSEELANAWDAPARAGQTIDVLAQMMAATLRVVSLSLLSKEVEHEAGKVGQALTVALAWANDQLTRPISLPMAVPTAGNRAIRNAVKALDEVVLTIIRERRASGQEGADLLGLLMAARDEESGAAMDDRQLRDEVMTIFLAGHETTANLLAWTFFLLSKNLLEARRLHAELDAALEGRTPGLADLPRLPLTRRILDEALRLYPPAWSFGRSAVEADTLGGYAIPQGSLVILNPYITHRLPAHWENPEGFDPDRFLPERSQDQARFAYFPFGGGPRQCIGNSFAIMEGVILLATLAQRFRLELLPGEEVEPEPSITLRPKGGLPMKLVRR